VVRKGKRILPRHTIEGEEPELVQEGGGESFPIPSSDAGLSPWGGRGEVKGEYEGEGGKGGDGGRRRKGVGGV